MKKLSLFSVIILISLTCCHAQDISGDWHWQSKDGKAMFDLTLKRINSNTIKGYHCSVFYGGKRIDCDTNHNKYSVILKKKSQNVYKGTIRSDYSVTKVSIKLTYNPSNDTILFQIIKQPDGVVYIPKKVTLNRR